MTLFDDIPYGSVISEITPLPKDPNLRRVRVGRRTIATLRAADIEQLRLKVGASWNAPLDAKVRQAIALNRARTLAMKLLGRRAYSSAEIVERLMALGHDRLDAQRISDELARAGWLNDSRLADVVIHQVTRTKPAGALLLKQRLKARRIGASQIEQSLAHCGDMKSEAASALEFAKVRLRRMTGLPNRTIQRRLAGVLTRRGFDDDTITSVLEHLQLSAPESD